jgi:ATP synthase F1 epsilon subunit
MADEHHEHTIHVYVVSAEEEIFDGEATFVALPGEAGELGIYPRHAPLITRIRPGTVRIKTPGNENDEFVFVAGGILEVQPDEVTVLAETRFADAISTRLERREQSNRQRRRLPTEKRSLTTRKRRLNWPPPRAIKCDRKVAPKTVAVVQSDQRY